MPVKCTHGSISLIKSLHVCHTSPSGDTNFGQTKFCQDVLPSLAKLRLAGTKFGQCQVWPDFVFKVGREGGGRGGGGSLGVRAVQVGACPAEGGPAEKIKWLPASPPSLLLPPPMLLGSSCLFAPLCNHALIALILLFSLCVQGGLGTPTLDELGREPAEDCIGLVPWQRLRTSPRTDDYENITGVNLRVWHGFVCAAARKMRPTDASAATPSADSQAVRQRLGTRNAGSTRERTSSTFPSIRGTATAVARKTLRGDGPAPRVERNLRSLECLQQRRKRRNDPFHSDRILPRLWLS